MRGRSSLPEAIQQVKAESLFWQREIYEKAVPHGSALLGPFGEFPKGKGYGNHRPGPYSGGDKGAGKQRVALSSDWHGSDWSIAASSLSSEQVDQLCHDGVLASWMPNGKEACHNHQKG